MGQGAPGSAPGAAPGAALGETAAENFMQNSLHAELDAGGAAVGAAPGGPNLFAAMRVPPTPARCACGNFESGRGDGLCNACRAAGKPPATPQPPSENQSPPPA